MPLKTAALLPFQGSCVQRLLAVCLAPTALLPPAPPFPGALLCNRAGLQGSSVQMAITLCNLARDGTHDSNFLDNGQNASPGRAGEQGTVWCGSKGGEGSMKTKCSDSDRSFPDPLPGPAVQGAQTTPTAAHRLPEGRAPRRRTGRRLYGPGCATDPECSCAARPPPRRPRASAGRRHPSARPELAAAEPRRAEGTAGPGAAGPLAAHCAPEPRAPRAAGGTRCNAENVRGSAGRWGGGGAGEGGGETDGEQRGDRGPGWAGGRRQGGAGEVGLEGGRRAAAQRKGPALRAGVLEARVGTRVGVRAGSGAARGVPTESSGTPKGGGSKRSAGPRSEGSGRPGRGAFVSAPGGLAGSAEPVCGGRGVRARLCACVCECERGAVWRWGAR
ncbi:translation initiation factor IF-2-like [Cebus imitator]|uniref:translation initiation factor IF-2-like n=1 Tax=Cebus imitator TaxID=2715852 RepID=UPI001898D52F|nr:translation initiation factor IF-2-like [Cebus imitator]